MEISASSGLRNRPRMLICYLCGREFGSKSLPIHIPQCQKKWLLEEQQKPKKERRPLPLQPAADKAIRTGGARAIDEFNSEESWRDGKDAPATTVTPTHILTQRCWPWSSKDEKVNEISREYNRSNRVGASDNDAGPLQHLNKLWNNALTVNDGFYPNHSSITPRHAPHCILQSLLALASFPILFRIAGTGPIAGSNHGNTKLPLPQNNGLYNPSVKQKIRGAGLQEDVNKYSPVGRDPGQSSKSRASCGQCGAQYQQPDSNFCSQCGSKRVGNKQHLSHNFDDVQRLGKRNPTSLKTTNSQNVLSPLQQNKNEPRPQRFHLVEVSRQTEFHPPVLVENLQRLNLGQGGLKRNFVQRKDVQHY